MPDGARLLVDDACVSTQPTAAAVLSVLARWHLVAEVILVLASTDSRWELCGPAVLFAGCQVLVGMRRLPRGRAAVPLCVPRLAACALGSSSGDLRFAAPDCDSRMAAGDLRPTTCRPFVSWCMATVAHPRASSPPGVLRLASVVLRLASGDLRLAIAGCDFRLAACGSLWQPASGGFRIAVEVALVLVFPHQRPAPGALRPAPGALRLAACGLMP